MQVNKLTFYKHNYEISQFDDMYKLLLLITTTYINYK